jgi:hypothetical protein
MSRFIPNVTTSPSFKEASQPGAEVSGFEPGCLFTKVPNCERSCTFNVIRGISATSFRSLCFLSYKICMQPGYCLVALDGYATVYKNQKKPSRQIMRTCLVAFQETASILCKA